MCLGIPMLVKSHEGNVAQCSVDTSPDTSIEKVDLSLVGPQKPGTWVLVFLGAAREVITVERAEQIRNALTAIEAVMNGKEIDVNDLFSDLVGEEPQLPSHLQNNN